MSFFSFVKSFFGDDPSQYVEPSDWEGFKNDAAIAVKNGTMTKGEAQELMGTFKFAIGEKARKFAEKVEAAIKLTPSDRVQTKIKEPQAVEAKVPEKSERTRNDDRLIGE